jgi:uncharacterized protein (TIGR01244 family)
MRSRVMISFLLLAAGLQAQSGAGQTVTKESVQGIRNFARIGTTVACAGTTSAEAVPELKNMGFASVINLRRSSEAGANVEAEEAAVTAAGLRYFHIPFDSSAPDIKAADRFVEAITSPGSEPAFIHCAGGNRAATMWLIKRLVVDGWELDRATEEATALGMTSPAMKQFAVDYASTHRR